MNCNLDVFEKKSITGPSELRGQGRSPPPVDPIDSFRNRCKTFSFNRPSITTPPSDLQTFQWLCVIWYNVLNLFLMEQFYVLCKKVFKRHLWRDDIVITQKLIFFWYEIVGGWKWECSFGNNLISNSLRITMNSWITIVGVISAIVDIFSICCSWQNLGIYRVSRLLVLTFDYNSWLFWLSYQKNLTLQF